MKFGNLVSEESGKWKVIHWQLKNSLITCKLHKRSR